MVGIEVQFSLAEAQAARFRVEIPCSVRTQKSDAEQVKEDFDGKIGQCCKRKFDNSNFSTKNKNKTKFETLTQVVVYVLVCFRSRPLNCGVRDNMSPR